MVTILREVPRITPATLQCFMFLTLMSEITPAGHTDLYSEKYWNLMHQIAVEQIVWMSCVFMNDFMLYCLVLVLVHTATSLGDRKVSWRFGFSSCKEGNIYTKTLVSSHNIFGLSEIAIRFTK